MLDGEDLVWLTDQEKEDYSLLSHMFDSPAWALFTKLIGTSVDSAATRLIQASSWEANRMAKGEMDAYLRILGYQTETEQMYHSIANERVLAAQNEVQDMHE
jgi:hypothetical protein